MPSREWPAQELTQVQSLAVLAPSTTSHQYNIRGPQVSVLLWVPRRHAGLVEMVGSAILTMEQLC